MITALALFASAALLGILAITLLNALLFPRLRPARAGGDDPLISVLIPARDEAGVVAGTVQALLAQRYPRFEIILLDDGSRDGTAAIAQAAAGGDPRFRVVEGSSLPAGWLGKNWACGQLAGQARGELLLFTDADVRWQPEALAALAAQMAATGADLLTVWPSQETVSRSERLVVPLMALTVIGYLPLPLVHHTPWPVFAAANGQCLLFRRRAYEASGGHEAVHGSIIEDIALARLVKGAGLRLRMADGAGLIACRMYGGWAAVRDGYAKNILAGYGSAAALLSATLFHWLIFLGPWVWLLAGRGTSGWPLWPAALIGLGLLARAISAAVTRQRPADALLMPLSVLLMTAIAARALWWHYTQGGPRWKGRTYVSDGRWQISAHSGPSWSGMAEQISEMQGGGGHE